MKKRKREKNGKIGVETRKEGDFAAALVSYSFFLFSSSLNERAVFVLFQKKRREKAGRMIIIFSFFLSGHGKRTESSSSSSFLFPCFLTFPSFLVVVF